MIDGFFVLTTHRTLDISYHIQPKMIQNLPHQHSSVQKLQHKNIYLQRNDAFPNALEAYRHPRRPFFKIFPHRFNWKLTINTHGPAYSIRDWLPEYWGYLNNSQKTPIALVPNWWLCFLIETWFGEINVGFPIYHNLVMIRHINVGLVLGVQVLLSWRDKYLKSCQRWIAKELAEVPCWIAG